ncbi:MAG: type 1 glutamine amidotransferase [Haloarculaceae archaeon]
MDRPRLALLNASYAKPMTRRNFRRELDADLVEFDVNEEQYPPDHAFDGFVVTGSAASVYWDEPWIPATETWVREAAERDLPGLGVCFGHQLVASALGGTVEAMDDYELGYAEVDRSPDVPLFDGLDRRLTAFESHSDAVTALPPGAEEIATNDRAIQGFRYGDVFTVQFHPEYDTESAARVTRGKDLPDERIERVLDGVTEENYARACETKRLFDNFVALVAARRAAEAAD